MGSTPFQSATPKQTRPAVVAEAEQAVFAPAVRAQVGVLEGEVVPGLAVGRVVLAHGAPLALGQVGAPAAPLARCGSVFARFLETSVLGGDVSRHGRKRMTGDQKIRRWCRPSLFYIRGVSGTQPPASPAPPVRTTSDPELPPPSGSAGRGRATSHAAHARGRAGPSVVPCLPAARATAPLAAPGPPAPRPARPSPSASRGGHGAAVAARRVRRARRARRRASSAPSTTASGPSTRPTR